MPTRDVNLRIFDVWHAACRILEYTADIDKETLRNSPMRTDAVLHNMEIIGEAAKHLPPEIQAQYASVDWANARAMRNVLAHGYDAVSFEILWRTLQQDIPPLEADLREDAKHFEEQGRWGKD